MKNDDNTYVPALRYRWLTRFYDPVVALTTREKTFRKKVLELVLVHDTQRVLDLGCGTGTLTRMMKLSSASMEVHGLDGDPEILVQARRKSRDLGLEIQFDEGLSISLPYPDDHFDLVVSSLFFHHLNPESKLRTLAELRRVLRAGGNLLVCDWGKPANPLLGLAFLFVRGLDGFEVTRENASGELPGLIAAAGFGQVTLTGRVSNMLGTLDLITAINP